jgi:hypothetical protein
MTSHRNRNWERDDQGEDPDVVRVSPGGTGINVSFKMAFVIGSGLIAGTAMAVTGYLNITGTAKRHTETLEIHSHALAQLETVTHDLDSKLNSLLWQSGINPSTVVRDAKDGKSNESSTSK